MDYIHTPYLPGDTIAALATPPGTGGIAVVRVSGKRALELSQPLFSKDLFALRSHTATLGEFLGVDGEVLDKGLILVMRAPRTFTGEETVEFHCHGGPVVVKKILEALFEAGVRPAKPGEFSFQAFMNGKIDLTEAEAIQNIIAAKGEGAYRAAKEHLCGGLKKAILSFKEQLTQQAAILEAWVDFPEEGLEFSTHAQMDATLASLIEEMQLLAATFEDGKSLQEGVRVAILGPPNAGKSSLLNALLRKERAIVTNIPGTTRDSLEEQMLLEGLALSLIDTAGIRATEEEVEKEGIRRAWECAEKADLILLVMDATRPELLSQFSTLPQQKVVLIWNKIDLLSPTQAKKLPKGFPISAKEGSGLEALKKFLKEKGAHVEKGDVILTSLRHFDALERAICSLVEVRAGLGEEKSPELLTHLTRESLRALGEIIGADITEEILSSVFSTFCVGK